MELCYKRFAQLLLLAATAVFAGCASGPAVSGNFEKSYTVSGPIRLELSNASGDVSITGSGDGKVHVSATVQASGMGMDDTKTRLRETLSNPPIEQIGDTIRIGRDVARLRNVSISYKIEVPRNTEVNTSIAAGAQTIRNVHGPVKAQAASGSIRVDHIDRYAQLNTASGTLTASDVGDDVRANSVSGNVAVSKIKGDVDISALAGTIEASQVGGRTSAETMSGSIDVQGATNDVKARSASGRVNVQGNPAANSYWELKTVSGSVQINVPSNANFHLTAGASTGEIRTDIPIVIEEQDKHSLRAHVGTNGGRVEIHTTSGEIRISGSN